MDYNQKETVLEKLAWVKKKSYQPFEATIVDKSKAT